MALILVKSKDSDYRITEVNLGDFMRDDWLCYFDFIVSRLKSVEAIKLEFVAPMPEQISTATMQFLKVSGICVS